MTTLQPRRRNRPRLDFAGRKVLGDSTFGQYWNKPFSPNASEPWIGPVAQGANDVLMITKALNAVGMSGITSYVKVTGNRTHIIITGSTASQELRDS